MAKTTTVYVVTDEVGTEEFTQISKALKFAGIKGKATKAEIEAGKFPMITIGEAEVDVDMEFKDEFATLERVQEDKAMDDSEPTMDDVDHYDDDETAKDIGGVPEDTVELAPEPVENPATQAALKAIEEAMNAVDDTIYPDLFDRLCDLEDSINDGITLTDKQAELMTQVLTNTYMDAEDTALTNTGDDNEEGSEEPIDGEPAPANDIEYPELGDFKDEKAMKKFIKGLSDESLQEWCILDGAEWKANDHQSINRMRMAMAIKAKHFPDTVAKKTKKSKSKYASYSTEDLVSMALDNEIDVPDDKGDNRILRMYTIMALRKAGLIE